MGDIIHSLPVIGVLRRNSQEILGKNNFELEISWLVSKKFKFLLENNNYINNIFELPENIFEIKNFLENLKNYNFDFVLDLQGLLKTGILASFINSKHKACLVPARENISQVFFDLKIQTSQVLDPKIHVITRNLNILKAINPEINLNEIAEKIKAPEYFNLEYKSLASNNYIKNNNYIICAPSSRWETKDWPKQNWIEFFERILYIKNLKNLKFIILDNKKNPEFQVFSERNPENFTDLSTKTSSQDLKALVSNAKLVIGSDSGILHMASAYGVKTLGLYGATSPYRTGPWCGNYIYLGTNSCNFAPCHKKICKYKNIKNNIKNCMREIDIKTVEKLLLELI